MIYCDKAVIGVILPMDIIRVIVVVFVTVVPLVLVNSLVVVRQIQSPHNIGILCDIAVATVTTIQPSGRNIMMPRRVRQRKRLFPIPNICSISTRVFQWTLLHRRNGQELSPNNHPLTCPCSKSAAKSQISPYERVVRTTWPFWLRC